MPRGSRWTVATLSLLLGGGLCIAADPPDSRVNSQTNLIETVDTTTQNNVARLRHTTTNDVGAQQIALITNAAVNDHDPHLSIGSNGDSWVVWWRESETPSVWLRKKTLATSSWSTETMLSNAGEHSKSPRVARDASKTWVAYIVVNQDNRSVVVTGANSPELFPPRSIVAATSYAGDLSLEIRAENGAVWISWIESGTTVGWVEYDAQGQAWSAAAYESYANDTVAAARERIAAAVLGG